MFCTDGQKCLSLNECTDCTFGKCIQLAKEKNSKGFSYSTNKECKLCANEHFANLREEEGWAVYARKGVVLD